MASRFVASWLHVVLLLVPLCWAALTFTARSRQSWLAGLKEQRKKELASINYNGSIYEVPSLKWTQTSYMQPQMHPYDLYFYDPVTHQYTVDRYLDDLKERYGGIDSLLLWPTYTNIGIDNRNQFDLFRTAPGGVSGLKAAIDQLHARGVKVLLPLNPWDSGTRREPVDDAHALDGLIKELDADGFNGDTMGSVPEEFYTASVGMGHPVAIEPEGGGDLPSMNWDTLGWGYWSYPWQPMVDHWKWNDPRRLTNVCDRWNQNKTNNLQAAWFNGDGYETWENIWSVWNGITPRDGEAIRRVGAMSRFFGGIGFLQSKDWAPHYPTMQNDWVFSSQWPLLNETLYTLVNRADIDAEGGQLVVDKQEGMHYYDCYHGTEIIPEVWTKATLSFEIEGLGYGCVLVTPKAAKPGDLTPLGQFLQYMQEITTYSEEWTCLPMHITPVLPTEPYSQAPDAGMVKIEKVESFNFAVTGVEIEGPFAVDVSYPWECPSGLCCPSRSHESTINIDAFYLDKYPVTNAQWKEYIGKTKYVPRDPMDYLRDWNNGTFPSGWDKKPVTWVSIQEARAYCKFYGKRLPREWEWQYAAQGTDGRKYPWGNNDDTSRYPKHVDGHTMIGPDDVDAHPTGCAASGMCDIIGNVWQYTDEFQDAHVRSAIMRGSSYYRPSGSMWYFPQAVQLDQHNKYMLWDECYERSGTIGFRCAADTAATTPVPHSPGQKYKVVPDTNCYAGHGARDIDENPVGGLTMDGCIDRCDADGQCTGAVYAQSNQLCWKRADIVLSQCQHDTSYEMLLRP